LLVLPIYLYGQSADSLYNTFNPEKWLAELNEKGLELSGDTIIINKEIIKLLQDAEYRKTVYPENYTWEQSIEFIQNLELKKAFWFFINLYPENEKYKEMVVKSILTYDKLFKMDEIIVNTFYTYCFTDPEIGSILNGKPEIHRPDILEAKLNVVKEIVTYLELYRAKEKSK
jgi:hypothetical protein